MDRLRHSLRETPIVEKEGYQYFVNPVSDGVPTVDPALLREIAVGILKQVDVADIDKIVTPEAMGIHISTAVSLVSDLPMVVVRKRSYGLPGELAIHQETGYSENEMYVNDVDEGDRVLLLDDVYSTGGTLSAVDVALEEIGAELVEAVAVIGKSDEEPTLPSGMPVTTLVDVAVEDGAVKILE